MFNITILIKNSIGVIGYTMGTQLDETMFLSFNFRLTFKINPYLYSLNPTPHFTTYYNIITILIWQHCPIVSNICMTLLYKLKLCFKQLLSLAIATLWISGVVHKWLYCYTVQYWVSGTIIRLEHFKVNYHPPTNVLQLFKYTEICFQMFASPAGGIR